MRKIIGAIVVATIGVTSIPAHAGWLKKFNDKMINNAIENSYQSNNSPNRNGYENRGACEIQLESTTTGELVQQKSCSMVDEYSCNKYNTQTSTTTTTSSFYEGKTCSDIGY